MTVLAKLTPGNFFRFSSSHQVNALREELERFAVARPEARALVPAELNASSLDDIGELLDLRRKCERDWGAPVSDLDLQRLRGGELFAVHKTLVLARLGRHPSEVTEGLSLGVAESVMSALSPATSFGSASSHGEHPMAVSLFCLHVTARPVAIMPTLSMPWHARALMYLSWTTNGLATPPVIQKALIRATVSRAMSLRLDRLLTA